MSTTQACMRWKKLSIMYKLQHLTHHLQSLESSSPTEIVPKTQNQQMSRFGVFSNSQLNKKIEDLRAE